VLRVATVFSGIGAIEHSLERMGLQHEMVFACDNSDIDPFSGPKTTVLLDESGTPVGSRLRVRRENARRKICTILKRLEEHGATVGEISCEIRCWHEECDVKDQELLEIAHVIPLSESPPLKDPMAWSNLRIYCANHHRAYDAGRDFENISPDLESYLRQAILSVDSPSARKLLVDELYGLSSRTPFVEQSYLANYEVPEGHFHKDVTFLDGTPYRDEVDLFVGGSPCQSFSFVGAQRGFEDARGTLFYDFVRLVEEIRPRMFIWENVKAVYSHDKGNTWDVISQCFDATGYTWHRAVLNAKDYGIPQFRQRVFVVGFRDGGEDFEFPEPVELRTTMQDFLEDRVAGKYFLGTKGVDFVTWDKNHRKQYTQIDGEVMLCQKANQQFNWHGDFVFVEENEGQHRVDEKYFLSQKVERYVLASGT
jgi:DNA (cytosine-5)-methyltransferase 1